MNDKPSCETCQSKGKYPECIYINGFKSPYFITYCYHYYERGSNNEETKTNRE